MVPWWSLLLMAALLLLIVFGPLLVSELQGLRSSRWQRIGRSEGLRLAGESFRRLLDQLRMHGTRYEITIRDWGEQYGSERWRWCIFDADALLMTEVSFEAHKMEDGAEIPFDQGNAATRIDAEMQALAAVERLANPQRYTVVTRGVTGPHAHADAQQRAREKAALIKPKIDPPITPLLLDPGDPGTLGMVAAIRPPQDYVGLIHEGLTPPVRPSPTTPSS